MFLSAAFDFWRYWELGGTRLAFWELTYIYVYAALDAFYRFTLFDILNSFCVYIAWNANLLSC
jgi:hypothetical protein